jgi:hypothetical protein
MKITIGLALASGLFLMVAGCATGRSAPAGGPGAAAGGGESVASAGGEIRNFNLEVKCPGVHFLKSHGKSDAAIVQQLQVDESDIARCEAWAASQPKGYVPPPPAGFVPSSKTTAPAAGGPAASSATH